MTQPSGTAGLHAAGVGAAEGPVRRELDDSRRAEHPVHADLRDGEPGVGAAGASTPTVAGVLLDAAAATFAARTVYDKNQFGVGAVKVDAQHRAVRYRRPRSSVTPATSTTTRRPTTTTRARRGRPTTARRASPARTTSPPAPTARCGSRTTSASSIGRIAHRRDRHQLPRQRASAARTASRQGTDGAMWFANTRRQHDRAGRPPTALFTSASQRPEDREPVPRRRRPGRRHVVHEQREQLGRVDHRRTAPRTSSTTRESRIRRASPPDPTAPCGSPTSTAARSGASRPPATVKIYGDCHLVAPLSITPGPDGALWFTNPGNNSIGRITTDGTITNFTDPEHLEPDRHRHRFRRRRCGSRTTATTRSAASRPSGIVTDYTDPTIYVPRRHRGRPRRRDLVHERRQQHDRADQRMSAGRRRARPRRADGRGRRCLGRGRRRAARRAGHPGRRRAVGGDGRQAPSSRWAEVTRACCRRPATVQCWGLNSSGQLGEQLAARTRRCRFRSPA